VLSESKILNDQRKFLTQKIGIGFSFVVLLIFFLIMLSDRNFVLLLPIALLSSALLVQFPVFVYPSLYFNKDEVLASYPLKADTCIPLHRIASLTKVRGFDSSIFDFPNPKRKFALKYLDTEGNDQSVRFSIALDDEGRQSLSELIDFIRYRNPSFYCDASLF
jgi:hypothetical protein